MAQKIQNCWEFMKCGREPGGDHIAELGVCPATVDNSFNGINRGKKGGRICWSIAGTFCGGEIQGTFAEKRESCQKCNFFKIVQAEEGIASLSNTFFSFFSQETILNNLTYKYVTTGERFIKQGEPGNTAYIIQRGSCLVIVEKDDQLHPVNEMLTGKRPFPEDNLGALMKMHRTQDIPDPGEIAPDLPEALRKLVIKAGRCDPDQRYQNVDQIIEDIRPLANHYNLKPSHVSSKKRNMSTFFLIYKDEHQLELNRLMEEFSTKVEEAGIVLEGADFQDVKF